MLVNFIKVDFREELLVQKYLELISSNVKPSEILVLVQNSNLRRKFEEKILKKIQINAIEKNAAYASSGLSVYTINISIPKDKKISLDFAINMIKELEYVNYVEEIY